MFLIVKYVNYNYIKKYYKRFCKKSNVKHKKLVTCNSFNELIIIFLFLFHNNCMKFVQTIKNDYNRKNFEKIIKIDTIDFFVYSI